MLTVLTIVVLIGLQKLSTSSDEGEDHRGGDSDAQNEPYAAEGRQPAVKIRDLKKVYPGGKVAVESLTLEVYEDHITALLGHNGAGKSTTISMLTGLIGPTGGDAHIWGHSIRDNMNGVRRYQILRILLFFFLISFTREWNPKTLNPNPIETEWF